MVSNLISIHNCSFYISKGIQETIASYVLYVLSCKNYVIQYDTSVHSLQMLDGVNLFICIIPGAVKQFSGHNLILFVAIKVHIFV